MAVNQDQPTQIHLRIVTPSRLVLEEDVDEVVLPGHLGAIGVLPQHTPLLARLGTGECEYSVGGEERFLAMSGGFVEVGPDRVTILADSAELPEEIDPERAQSQIDRAQKALKRAALRDVDVAMVRMKRGLTRLRVHRRWGDGD
jgi:F-type H+-transporting ATPase subunit epsilon